MNQVISVSKTVYHHHKDAIEALKRRDGLSYRVLDRVDEEPIYIDDNFVVRLWLTLPHREREQLALFFHSLDEAWAFAVAHPEPQTEYPALISEYGARLRSGALVAFPTETVYGLGADATNEAAVRSIFEAKQRPLFDPLIVHVASIEQLDGVVEHLDDRAKALIDHFWPGPLTLVVPKGDAIVPIVTSGGDTVAIRMPDNPFALSLIAESGRPIAAPSANRFGYTSPTTAAHVAAQLGSKVSAILDGGSCEVGIESTVLSLATSTATILRPGKIGPAELKPIIGDVVYADSAHSATLESPGLLENHYAPTTPLYLVSDVTAYKDDPNVGVLLFDRVDTTFQGPVRHISNNEDPLEAARRLYWAMRELDGLGLAMMVCSPLKEEGIAVAINNRLRKASQKR